jgi:transposase
MPKRVDFTLRPDEQRALDSLIQKGDDPVVVQRAKALLMLHAGDSPKEVAKKCYVSLQTVYNWRQRWREQGVDGLLDRPISGRKPKADEQYLAVLTEALKRPSGQNSRISAPWTVSSLLAHMSEVTGVRLSERRFREILESIDNGELHLKVGPWRTAAERRRDAEALAAREAEMREEAARRQQEAQPLLNRLFSRKQYGNS